MHVASNVSHGERTGLRHDAANAASSSSPNPSLGVLPCIRLTGVPWRMPTGTRRAGQSASRLPPLRLGPYFDIRIRKLRCRVRRSQECDPSSHRTVPEQKRMTVPLTPLQRSVIERLNVLGMEDFASRATIAWQDGARYPCALTPAERATMEGATLCNDFKRANAEVARTATPVNTGPAA